LNYKGIIFACNLIQGLKMAIKALYALGRFSNTVESFLYKVSKKIL
jgi:hypothetical protein